MRHAALLAVLLLVPAALADGDPESQASAQFKQVVKQALAALKPQIKGAEKEAIAALADLEHQLPDLLLSTAAVADDVADILETYQIAVVAAATDSYENVALNCSDILELLDVQVDLGNGFPEAFLAGGYGPADLLRGKVHQLLDKSVARLRKRLGKTLTVVHDTQGYRMTARLQTPRALREFASDESIGTYIDTNTPLTIDFAVAVSSDAAAGDALVVAGGQADNLAGAVNIDLTGEDSLSSSALPDEPTQRWRQKLDDAGDFLLEENAILGVSQGGGPELLAIGLP